MNERGKRFLRGIMNSAGYIAVFLVCAAYIATALIGITGGGKTVEQILSDTAIIFILGITINRLSDSQGMINGKNDPEFKATQHLHSDVVLRVAPYIDKLDEWCTIKNAENLKDQRIKILAAKALRYDDYFGDNGKPYEVDEKRIANKYTKKSELERLAAYEKALNLRLTPITSGSMTTDGEHPEDPYKPARSKRSYEAGRTVYDIISRFVTAIILGYYSVALLENFQWDKLIWHAFQVCLFIVCGVIRMQQSYIYITDEYRQSIVRKIDNLSKFEGWVKEKYPKNETKGDVNNGQ